MRTSPPLALLVLTGVLGSGVLVATSLAAPGSPAPAPAAPAKPSPRPAADADAVRTCVAFLSAPIDPKAVTDLAAEQRHFVDACKGVVADASCRRAWDRAATAAAGDPMVFFTKAAEGCRLAYCPLLPGHPAACDGRSPSVEASAQLFGMILNLDLGPTDGAKVGAALVDWARRRSIAPINISVTLPSCQPQTASVSLVKGGAWIGVQQGTQRGAPASARCFVPRHAGALDATVLDAELGAAHAAACTTALEIAATSGLTYDDLVFGMDHAIKAGFTDLGVTDEPGLSVAFGDSVAAEKSAPAHCTATNVTPPAATTGSGTSSKTPSSSKAPRAPAPRGLPQPKPPADDFKNVPVIVITMTEVSVGGETVATVKDLLTGTGSIARLVTLLKARPTPASPAAQGVAIVQGDGRVDALVIVRAIKSAKDAGYDNLLFAVKNK